jgi:hypothetical protein
VRKEGKESQIQEWKWLEKSLKTSGRVTFGKSKERGVAAGERGEIPGEREGRHNPDLGRGMALFCGQ